MKQEEKQKPFKAIIDNDKTNNLEKVIKPKFNVGDKIVDTLRKQFGCCGASGKISQITDNEYIFTDGSHLLISNQEKWELVPNL